MRTALRGTPSACGFEIPLKRSDFIGRVPLSINTAVATGTGLQNSTGSFYLHRTPALPLNNCSASIGIPSGASWLHKVT